MTDDLRVEDNPALNLAAADDRLAIVYCVDNSLFQTDKFGCRGIGQHRWGFLRETLQDLNQRLAERGQMLHILEGSPFRVLTELLDTSLFSRVIRTRGHDHSTNVWWRQLESAGAQREQPKFIEVDGSTLYQSGQVNEMPSFPKTFSQFRNSLSDLPYRKISTAKDRLPPTLELDSRLVSAPVQSTVIAGGASAAGQRLDEYFNSGSASTYKETRNALQGRNYATGLSPYLANGCLSPLQVYERLHQYESERGQNESTRWILFELLWREFFRWYGEHHGSRLFAFTGVNGRRPLTTFYRERFIKWCEGDTPYPLVNACMHELNETGFISNRARQIVASCLVNELGLDWRCGASYFAQQLIDHDVCSNWGNWQYIAGVGADPRGGRHFNIEKQAELFDPDESYQLKWQGTPSTLPLDSQDYHGWPVMPSDT